MRTGLRKKLLSLGLYQGIAQVWRPWRLHPFCSTSRVRGAKLAVVCDFKPVHRLHFFKLELLQWTGGHLALGAISQKAFFSDSIISSPVLLLHMSCIVSGCFSSPLAWRNAQSQPGVWAHTAEARWLVLFLGLLKGWRIYILFSEEGVSMCFSWAHFCVYLEYDPWLCKSI